MRTEFGRSLSYADTEPSSHDRLFVRSLVLYVVRRLGSEPTSWTAAMDPPTAEENNDDVGSWCDGDEQGKDGDVADALRPDEITE